jgi:NADH:ubiquinone oxidoreductase subunit D
MSTLTSPEFKTLTINMGPQHPSTHGVLRLVIELDGETVVTLKPVMGYLHTGMEKIMESKTYTKSITVTDRMDYLSPLGNNMAYVGAVERIMGLEIPERAQVLRLILLELTGISSHLVWLGTHATSAPPGVFPTASASARSSSTCDMVASASRQLLPHRRLLPDVPTRSSCS